MKNALLLLDYLNETNCSWLLIRIAQEAYVLSAHERRQIMNDHSMKKDYDDYELREEYDLAKLPIMPKGRFAPERRAGKNVVVLAPDVAQAFPDDKSVNEALRLVLRMAKIPQVQQG